MYGLITGINTHISDDLWDSLRTRLEAAAETADDEQLTEVIAPLLELFKK